MPKTITKQMRRKMLTAHEQGASYPELKQLFGITDSRTLQRHLIKAESEREAREVRIRIITDSQKMHLEEICSIAVKLQERIRLEFPAGRFDLSLENEELFTALPNHFPNDSIWKNYDRWKVSATKYHMIWEELVTKGVNEAKKALGINGYVEGTEGIANYFVSSALCYSMDLRDQFINPKKKDLTREEDAEKIPAVESLYEERKIQSSVPLALEFLPHKQDIAWGTVNSVLLYINEHYVLIKVFWHDPRVIELVNLKKKIIELEIQLNREFHLALLKRSYISCTCDFCPVKAFHDGDV